jgi:two-component system, cell cycle sensor histidine kinase and response regulator CckA
MDGVAGPMTDSSVKDLAAIRAELDRLHGLAENVPATLLYWSRDLRCQYANRAAAAWFGQTPETIMGRTMPEVLGAIYERHLPHIDAVLAGEEQRFDSEIPDPSGGMRHSQVHYIPDVVDGEVRGIYVLVTDLTHRAKAEDAVRSIERQAHATERLSAIATLTQSIAHEINNPLAIALLGLDDALDQLDTGQAEPAALRESLLSAREGMSRMVGIVQSMKLLARLDATEREQIDVKATLEESIALATTEIRYRASLSSDLEDVGVIDGNAAQLTQVFVSLLRNVAHALPEENAERNEIRVTTRRSAGNIVIEITDNGRTDSSKEPPQRAFDRFFTTADASGGIGLGLSVARDVVTSLGGAIGIETTASGGSLLRITLPPAPEQLKLPSASIAPSSDAPARSSSHRGLGRRGRILVIDDEPLVGRSLKRHLAPRYDVEAVTRGREAIDRAIDERYDVILCDLMMPDVSGADVYAEVTAARPELADRFIFMTGGAFTAKGREFLQAVSAPVLAKPFDLPILDATVRRVVETAGDVRTTPTAMRRPGARD